MHAYLSFEDVYIFLDDWNSQCGNYFLAAFSFWSSFNLPSCLVGSVFWLQEKLFSSKNRTEASLGKKLKLDVLPEVEKVLKVIFTF